MDMTGSINKAEMCTYSMGIKREGPYWSILKKVNELNHLDLLMTLKWLVKL